MQNRIQIDCQACRTSGSMQATTIPRFSGIVRVIGVILVIPSILGMCLAGILLLSFFAGMSQMSAAQSDAELAGQAVGSAIGVIFIVIIGIVSFVSGLIGWLLLMSKKVFKCVVCTFVMDRG